MGRLLCSLSVYLRTSDVIGMVEGNEPSCASRQASDMITLRGGEQSSLVMGV